MRLKVKKLIISIFCCTVLSIIGCNLITYEHWNVFSCNIEDFGTFTCVEGNKNICNYNSKLEFLDSMYDLKMDCSNRGLACNTENDGGWCTENDEIILDMINIYLNTDYTDIEEVKDIGLYHSFRCRVP